MSFFHRAKRQVKQTARNLALMLIGVVLGILTLGLILLYQFREIIIKATVLPRISHVTGFKAEAESLKHEFPLRLTLTNVTMENPKGFKPKLFASAPYFYIDIDLPSLLEGKVFRIREWRMVISKLNLERSKEGVINGALLKAIKNFASGKAPGEPGGGAGTVSSMDFFMDRLEIRLDQIRFRDLTGVLPQKTLRQLKLRAHAYDNTQYFSDLIDQIEKDVMKEMNLGSRVELSPFYIERSLKKTADSVVSTTEKLVEGAGKVVKTTTIKAPAEILKTTAGIIGIKSDADKETKEKTADTSAPQPSSAEPSSN